MLPLWMFDFSSPLPNSVRLLKLSSTKRIIWIQFLLCWFHVLLCRLLFVMFITINIIFLLQNKTCCVSQTRTILFLYTYDTETSCLTFSHLLRSFYLVHKKRYTKILLYMCVCTHTYQYTNQLAQENYYVQSRHYKKAFNKSED